MAEVAVLGCGPAGLLAAHAVAMAGHEPYIISQKVKSHISGAQYLHEPIEPLTAAEPEGAVMFLKIGDRAGYARKVYGSESAPVSWDKFDDGEYPAWSMHSLYEVLWACYHRNIYDYHIKLSDLPEIRDSYPLVISTIPAKMLCINEFHAFEGKDIWIVPAAPRGMEDFVKDSSLDNVVVYSGRDCDLWYRASEIFGHVATETAREVAPDAIDRAAGYTDDDVIPGVKPTSHNCDCHPEIKRAGRFGRWERGVLIHHAYQQAKEEINAVHSL